MKRRESRRVNTNKLLCAGFHNTNESWIRVLVELSSAKREQGMLLMRAGTMLTEYNLSPVIEDNVVVWNIRPRKVLTGVAPVIASTRKCGRALIVSRLISG